LKNLENGYDRRVVHSLNDLQTIYQRTKELNYILDEPVQIHKIQYFYSGKFIYNMNKFLSNRKESVFSDGKYLPDNCAKEFVKIKSIMLANLKVATSTKAFKVHICKKRKIEVVPETVESGREAVSDISSSSDEEVGNGGYRDVNNKFALLQAE